MQSVEEEGRKAVVIDIRQATDVIYIFGNKKDFKDWQTVVWVILRPMSYPH